MKVIKNCFLRTLSVLFILCFLTVPAAFSAPVDLLPFENLTEDIGRGFGDNWNRYAWSMEEFNGDVYVGTWSVQFDWPGLIESLMSGDFDLGSGNPLEGIGILESRGGEIWKHEGGQNWTKVYKAGESDAGFRKMLEYNGNLYAGTANSEEGTNLYSSSGGATWTPLAGGPLDNADNNSIRTMMVCDGKLFVGTENNATGGELWAYNDNGSNWEQKGAGQFGGDPAVGQVATFNDKLYVGTWNFTDNFKLFMSVDGGDNFTDVTPNFAGSSDLMNLGVMKLVEFQGQFYLGTVNYLNGFTLLRASDPSNPSGWEVISTNGLGDPSNAYTWSMEVFDNTLYMGTFNSGLFGGIYDPLPIPLDGRAQQGVSGKNSERYRKTCRWTG